MPWVEVFQMCLPFTVPQPDKLVDLLVTEVSSLGVPQQRQAASCFQASAGPVQILLTSGCLIIANTALEEFLQGGKIFLFHSYTMELILSLLDGSYLVNFAEPWFSNLKNWEQGFQCCRIELRIK